jgi:NAD(P)-dependent dehydrogenase (short-subunit alcohol dehydrogenase family)
MPNIVDRERQFEDKIVLVTGASGGIGRAISRGFLQGGAQVALHSCGSGLVEEQALAVEDGRAVVLRADFRDDLEVTRLWDEFTAWSEGRIDILVNNAGLSPRGEDLETSWGDVFNVNAKAPFLLSRRAMPVMGVAGSGRIVNISSIGVRYGGSTGSYTYSLAKAALEALTKSLAKIGAGDNVLVNTVRAGVTDTALQASRTDEQLRRRVDLIPVGRMATPEEIAQAVLFLAGPESAFVTGTVLTVAGGE